MTMEKKKLSEITRLEWIKFRWLEDDAMGEEERVFIKNGMRTPHEARQAMEDWDSVEEGLKSETENEE